MTKKLPKQEKLKKLNDKIVSALAFAEDEEIPVSLVLQIAGNNLSEFGLCLTHGDIASTMGLLLHSFERSVMRRTNSDQHEDISEHVKIDIQVSHEIFGHEDLATALLLSSFFHSIQAMLENYDRHSQRLH